MAEHEALTLPESAQMFRVTPGTARRWVPSGLVPRIKVGRALVVARKDTDDLMRSGRSQHVQDKAAKILALVALYAASLLLPRATHAQTMLSALGNSDPTLRIRGGYQSTRSYEANDVVLSEGLLYRANARTNGQAPEIPSGVWSVLVAPVTLLYTGEYRPLAVYQAGSFVLYEGSLWVSLHLVNTGNRPEIGSLDWALLAAAESKK